MKNTISFVLYFAFLLVACKPKMTVPSPGLLSVDDAKELIKDANTVLIDVRTPSEIELGAIEGAHPININAEDFMDKITQLDTSRTYIVYCKRGGRSARALGIMKEMGFKKVYDLEGGYDSWMKTE